MENFQKQQLTIQPSLFLLIEANASLEEIEKELDAHPSDINCEYEASTPLIKSAWTGREDLVRLLISRGAKINQPAGDQLTPLKRAIRRKDDFMVSLLLELGAMVNEHYYTKLNKISPLDEALWQYDFLSSKQNNYESLEKMGKIIWLLKQRRATITRVPGYGNKTKERYEIYMKQIEDKFSKQIIVYQSPETILFGNNTI